LDPGFGSSNFAIVCTQLVDGKIQLIAAEEYDRLDFTEMINEVWNLKQKCGHVTNIYADAANPEVWQALKKEFNEPFNEQYIKDKIAYAKKYNLHIEDQMFIVPVPFSIEGARMLQHTKWLLEETDEDGSGLVAMHRERFQKLVTALRTAGFSERSRPRVMVLDNTHCSSCQRILGMPAWIELIGTPVIEPHLAVSYGGSQAHEDHSFTTALTRAGDC
jgi:hypothetical protein